MELAYSPLDPEEEERDVFQRLALLEFQVEENDRAIKQIMKCIDVVGDALNIIADEFLKDTASKIAGRAKHVDEVPETDPA